MTTAVKVDAHAGWPVEVVLEYGEPGHTARTEIQTVPALTDRTFYIHSGLRIGSIVEQAFPKPE